jgi:hypothetical protein
MGNASEHEPRRTADGYCACDGCVKHIWEAYRAACKMLTNAEERLVSVRKIAHELARQGDWLNNGHRASDYGHDVLIAAGEPALAHVR